MTKHENIAKALKVRLSELTNRVVEIDSELRKPLSADLEEQATEFGMTSFSALKRQVRIGAIRKHRSNSSRASRPMVASLPVTACVTAELTSRARTQPFGQSGSRKNCYVEAARSPAFLARLVSAARRMS